MAKNKQPKNTSNTAKPSHQSKLDTVRLNTATLERVGNPTLPTLWIDAVSVSARADVPIALLRFYTTLPSERKSIEGARVQMSITQLNSLADLIARTTGYYATAESVSKNTRTDETLSEKPPHVT